MDKKVTGPWRSGWKAVFALAAFALSLAGGCSTDQSNFLKNPKFEKWNGGPVGWLLEGEAKVTKTGSGAELKSGGTATPFLYQTFEIKRRYRGSTVTLAAWVKTNVAEGAVIEFSDRKGHDAKSGAHPGDGEWRLLTLTVKVPDSPGNIEFRFRNYKAGSSFIREASMSTGEDPLIAKRAGGEVSVAGGYKAAGYLLIVTLLSAELLFFKKVSSLPYARVYEAFLVLLTLSALMLIAGRPVNAAVTANLAWVVIVLALLTKLIRKLDPVPVKNALTRLFKRPGAVFITASLVLIAATVNALRNGSVREAEMAARGAYILMLLGGASVVVRMVSRGLRAEENDSVRIYKRQREKADAMNGETEGGYSKPEAEKTLTT